MAKQKVQGFSLIEVMIVVSIAAILLGISVYGIKALMGSNHLQTAVDDFHTSLIYSRVEAVSLQMNVAVCPKKTGQVACEDDAAQQDYAAGWLVFSDCDNDGVFDNTNVCDRDLDGTNDATELLKLYELDKKNPLSILGDAKYKDIIMYQLTGRTTEGAGEFAFSADSKTAKIKVSRIGMVTRE